MSVKLIIFIFYRMIDTGRGTGIFSDCLGGLAAFSRLFRDGIVVRVKGVCKQGVFGSGDLEDKAPEFPVDQRSGKALLFDLLFSKGCEESQGFWVFEEGAGYLLEPLGVASGFEGVVVAQGSAGAGSFSAS